MRAKQRPTAYRYDRQDPSPVPRPFHVMTKPIWLRCNLDCSDSYYLDKEKLYPDASKFRMPDTVLEAYVRA